MENSIQIIKGVGVALLTTLLCLIIFAIILTYTSVGEACIDPVIIVITGISILLGSFLSNMKMKKNGMLNGGIVGLAYLLILYIISSLLNWRFGLSWRSIIMLAVGILCGILGRNFRSKHKKIVAKFCTFCQLMSKRVILESQRIQKIKFYQKSIDKVAF